MMRLSSPPFLAFLVLIFFPLHLHAHGEGVKTFTTTTDSGYLIDVDYEAPEIEAGVSGTFMFKLFNDVSRTETVPYKDLWVRIIKEDGSAQGNTIFAGPIAKPEFGQPRLLFMFPYEGRYTLAVRYNQDEEQEVIEAKFPFSVEQSAGEQGFKLNSDFFVGAGGGIILAFVLCALFALVKRKHAR